ncbi:hypothetical protein AKJ09_11064 [Labilithrix luteola]|uniref:Uncharacterized protein n=1 Tax=Labilithrix luteola TaxID=1391654 RepID=A0A0K1QF49_9BACT|nr:hypothetical protein AKJ09_11064 [Labilithrix luteola]
MGALVGLASNRASAQERSELRTRISFSAPSTCPDEQRFRALLAQHSEAIVDDDAPITLRIEVTKDEKGHRGRVALLTVEEEGTREVAAKRCEDVVRGLALFSAIALDAYLERLAAEAHAPPAPPPAPPSLPVVEQEQASRAVTSDAPRKRIARPPASRSVVVDGAVGFALGARNAAGSGLVYGAGVSGELGIMHRFRSSLRAGLNLGARVPETHREGTLSFGMAWLQIDACPGWVAFGRTFSAAVCPSAEIGVQRAALDDIAMGRTELRPWLSLGGVGRMRAALGNTVELEASVGLVAPVLRYDFLTIGGEVFATPNLVPTATFGAVLPIF